MLEWLTGTNPELSTYYIPCAKVQCELHVYALVLTTFGYISNSLFCIRRILSICKPHGNMLFDI